MKVYIRLLALIVCGILLGMSVQAAASGGITVRFQGQPIEFGKKKPKIIDGEVYVPAVPAAEAILGLKPAWDKKNADLLVLAPGYEIDFQQSKLILRTGRETIEPPVRKDKKTAWVPLKWLVSQTTYGYKWDARNKIATIDRPKREAVSS
ncbi:stalk domain-containing protein [Cohnella sp. CFH 77786]|uniref:stalk domain-containing protein n=1 Tax=Cohnella sp. CFH 77786 TaxID=2662265 RepID=UPI001C60F1B2|nr:stalk domain-containing protein [Cohnella sp. CFH 77786]